jgi:peptidoglycan/xylan/chitin deacetylase (PgdA/CDA1 family)
MMPAVALMYHDVVPAGAEDSSGFPGRDAARYKVTPQQFARHLERIGQLDTPPVLTFDDGGLSAMVIAAALEQRGLRGYFFVTANYLGNRSFVGPADLRDLHQRGHIVGSHSCSHPLRLGHCARPQLQEEWERSRSILENILGAAVTAASIPGGDFAPAVAETAAEAGFSTLFSSEPTRTTRRFDGLELRGRYTIQSWTTEEEAAALASGKALACTRQALVWNVKKTGKLVGGDYYLRIRKLLLRHGNEVRWGDTSSS